MGGGRGLCRKHAAGPHGHGAGAAGAAGAAAAGSASGTAGGFIAGLLRGFGLLGVLSLSGSTRKEDERETVTVFRVESAAGGNARFVIDANGGITLLRPDKKVLHLNFGDRARAIEFLRQKVFGGDVPSPVSKRFEVRKAFVDRLRSAAIPQKGASSIDPNKQLPRRVDKTKAEDQFEIPAGWLEELRRQIIQGTGRVETPEDVGIRPPKR